MCSNYGNLAINITNFTVYIILPPIGKQMVNCSGFTIDLAVQGEHGTGGGGGVLGVVGWSFCGEHLMDESF